MPVQEAKPDVVFAQKRLIVRKIGRCYLWLATWYIQRNRSFKMVAGTSILPKRGIFLFWLKH